MTMSKKGRGFLTFAIGEDYLRMAYAQALSIKASQTNNNYAVIVDEATFKLVEPKHYLVFDHVGKLLEPVNNPMEAEWQAYTLTPWDLTIKLDADMLLMSSIDHWWQHLAEHDIVMSTTAIDFRGNKITSRAHRKLFDDNLLPDVYTAFMFFQAGKDSSSIFYYAERFTKAWADSGIQTIDSKLKTDELFAVCARIVGAEKVTLPIALPAFVHGKSELWGLGSVPWYEQLYTQWDNDKLRVGHHVQSLPFHYHHKEWLTDDIVERLERQHSNTGSRIRSP